MTNETLPKNLELIHERWPSIHKLLSELQYLDQITLSEEGEVPTLLVGDVHLTSCFDRQNEAQVQSQAVPEGAAVVWQYGIGLGDLSRQLLTRTELKKLNVVIMNIHIFKASMQYFDYSDWLDDGRVELLLAGDQKDIQAPFCVAPAELRLPDNTAERLSDLLVLELDTPYINAKVRNNKVYLKQIEENYARLSEDRQAKELFGTAVGKQAMVVAAGPSLSESYELIKARDPADTLLIAVDATAKPLAAQGIYPDVVVTVDGFREAIKKLFDFSLDSFGNTPLVYFPIVHKEVLEGWPGPRYFSYSGSPLYQDLQTHFPGNGLFCAGTVFHTAVDLAVQMGVGQVVLIGADFSFPNMQSHVGGAVFQHKVDPGIFQEEVIDGHGDRVRTSKSLRGYLRDFERYVAANRRVKFVNVSRSGAMIEGAVYHDTL